MRHIFKFIKKNRIFSYKRLSLQTSPKEMLDQCDQGLTTAFELLNTLDQHSHATALQLLKETARLLSTIELFPDTMTRLQHHAACFSLVKACAAICAEACGGKHYETHEGKKIYSSIQKQMSTIIHPLLHDSPQKIECFDWKQVDRYLATQYHAIAEALHDTQGTAPELFHHVVMWNEHLLHCDFLPTLTQTASRDLKGPLANAPAVQQLPQNDFTRVRDAIDRRAAILEDGMTVCIAISDDIDDEQEHTLPYRYASQKALPLQDALNQIGRGSVLGEIQQKAHDKLQCNNESVKQQLALQSLKILTDDNTSDALDLLSDKVRTLLINPARFLAHADLPAEHEIDDFVNRIPDLHDGLTDYLTAALRKSASEPGERKTLKTGIDCFRSAVIHYFHSTALQDNVIASALVDDICSDYHYDVLFEWLLDIPESVCVFRLNETNGNDANTLVGVVTLNPLHPATQPDLQQMTEMFDYCVRDTQDDEACIDSPYCKQLLYDAQFGNFRVMYHQPPALTIEANADIVALLIRQAGDAYITLHQRCLTMTQLSEKAVKEAQKQWSHLRLLRKLIPDNPHLECLDFMFQRNICDRSPEDFPELSAVTIHPTHIARDVLTLFNAIPRQSNYWPKVFVLDTSLLDPLYASDISVPHPYKGNTDISLKEFVMTQIASNPGYYSGDKLLNFDYRCARLRNALPDRDLRKKAVITYLLHTLYYHSEQEPIDMNFMRDLAARLLQALKDDTTRPADLQHQCRNFIQENYNWLRFLYEPDDWESLLKEMTYVDVYYDNQPFAKRYPQFVPTDGDCFYHALSHGAAARENCAGDNLDLLGKDVVQLRQYTSTLMTHMIRHWDKTDWNTARSDSPEFERIAKAPRRDSSQVMQNIFNEITSVLGGNIYTISTASFEHPTLFPLLCQHFSAFFGTSLNIYANPEKTKEVFNDNGTLKDHMLPKLFPNPDMRALIGPKVKDGLEAALQTYRALHHQPHSQEDLNACLPSSILLDAFQSLAMDPTAWSNPAMQGLALAYAKDVALTPQLYRDHVFMQLDTWFQPADHGPPPTLNTANEMSLKSFIDHLFNGLPPLPIDTDKIKKCFMLFLRQGYKDPHTGQHTSTFTRTESIILLQNCIKAKWATQPEITLLAQLFDIDTTSPAAGNTYHNCGASRLYKDGERPSDSTILLMLEDNHYWALGLEPEDFDLPDECLSSDSDGDTSIAESDEEDGPNPKQAKLSVEHTDVKQLTGAQAPSSTKGLDRAPHATG